MQKNITLLRFVLPLLLVAIAAVVFLWPREEESTSAAAPPARPRLPVQTVAMQSAPARNVSFDDLAFDVEADQPFDRELITGSIEALDGVHLKVRGFMLPTYRAEGIEEFVLVRDNQVCCFGPGAKICHNMQIYMVDGASASYTTRAVEVEGLFSIQTWTGDDGVIYSCYRIDATRVRSL